MFGRTYEKRPGIARPLCISESEKFDSAPLVAAGGGLLELKNQNGDTLLTDQRLRARSGSDKTIFDN